MPTTAGNQSNPGELLNSLLELCHDLRAGHEAALATVKRETALKLLHDGTALLDSQIKRLKEPAYRISTNPSNTPDPRALFERAKVRVAGLVGEDVAIKALLGSLSDLHQAYARALESDILPEAAKFLSKQLHAETEKQMEALRVEVADQARHSESKSQDHDEVTRGRAMPRVDAQAPRLNNSSDY